jgi:predicted  nucleic acid-binding Zn-ribbon protein
MDTKQLLLCLLELQSLEFDKAERDESAKKEAHKKIAELRLQIPLPILNHYDRLRVRGKKGAAAVSHQTCTGCHVQVTRAVVINLMHGEDIQVCENCGRYLYLLQPKESGLLESREKPAAKSRKPMELSCAA